MAFQTPSVMVTQVLEDVPTTSMGPLANTATPTEETLRALVDRRQGLLGEIAATGPNAGLFFNFASGVGLVNQLVIPAGHNLAGLTPTIDRPSDPDATFPPVTGTGVYAESPSSTIFGDAAIGLLFPETTNGQILRAGEFALGQKFPVAQGKINQSWSFGVVSNQATQDFGSSTSVVELGPARAEFSLRVDRVRPTDPTYTILETISRLGRPFWYWTTDTENEGPFLVRLTRFRREQDFSVPASTDPGPSYSIQLEMLEEAA